MRSLIRRPQRHRRSSSARGVGSPCYGRRHRHCQPSRQEPPPSAASRDDRKARNCVRCGRRKAALHCKPRAAAEPRRRGSACDLCLSGLCRESDTRDLAVCGAGTCAANADSRTQRPGAAVRRRATRPGHPAGRPSAHAERAPQPRQGSATRTLSCVCDAGIVAAQGHGQPQSGRQSGCAPGAASGGQSRALATSGRSWRTGTRCLRGRRQCLTAEQTALFVHGRSDFAHWGALGAYARSSRS